MLRWKADESHFKVRAGKDLEQLRVILWELLSVLFRSRVTGRGW